MGKVLDAVVAAAKEGKNVMYVGLQGYELKPVFIHMPEPEDDDNPPVSKELSKRIKKAGCKTFYEYRMKVLEKEIERQRRLESKKSHKGLQH